MNDPQSASIILLVVAIALVALLPTIIAFYRKHHYRWIIFAINIVLGATGVGYLVALVWAIWPSQTGLADVLLNDPTSNSHAANQIIYSRYGANAQAFHNAQSAKQIYVFCKNQQYGPYTIAEVHSLVSSGRISQSDLAWCEGAEDWMPLSTISEVAVGFVPPPPDL